MDKQDILHLPKIHLHFIDPNGAKKRSVMCDKLYLRVMDRGTS